MAAREVGSERVSASTHRVLAALLRRPSCDRWFALDLCRLTGIGSGRMAATLVRMERWGWIDSRWESREDASGHGRPRRRFYRLTGTGRRVARHLLRLPPPLQVIWTHLR